MDIQRSYQVHLTPWRSTPKQHRCHGPEMWFLLEVVLIIPAFTFSNQLIGDKMEATAAVVAAFHPFLR